MSDADPMVGNRREPRAIRNREGRLDPFDWYARMREESPVYFDERRQTWDVFRYEDVNRVLTEHDTFTSRLVQDGTGSQSSTGDDNLIAQTMILQDPPDHDRLRGFVNERFQPGSLREYRPRIEELTGELLDRIDGADCFDFVEGLAVPLPVIVIAELLGIPAERREQFKEWSDALIARPEDDTEASMERVQRERRRAGQEMGEYFAQLLTERQAGDDDDLVTLAATADELTREERIGFCMLLLLAGNITTTNLLTNAFWCFEEHDVTDAVRTGDVDRQKAIEEVLRYRSPIQDLTRIATEDAELNGRQIEAGDALTVWLGSANRDPEVFDAPEEFRPERRANRHMAFGKGVHYCLGAPLARLEADVALDGLLDRLDQIDADLTNLRPLSGLYGLKSLPCTVRS